MVYHKVQPLRPLDNQSDPLIRPFFFQYQMTNFIVIGSHYLDRSAIKTFFVGLEHGLTTKTSL